MAENGELPMDDSAPKAEKTDTDGFELPDFLKDIEEGIIKIQ